MKHKNHKGKKPQYLNSWSGTNTRHNDRAGAFAGFIDAVRSGRVFCRLWVADGLSDLQCQPLK